MFWSNMILLSCLCHLYWSCTEGDLLLGETHLEEEVTKQLSADDRESLVLS